MAARGFSADMMPDLRDRRGALSCAPLFYLALGFVFCVTFLGHAPATEEEHREAHALAIRLSGENKQFEVHGVAPALLDKLTDAQLQAGLIVGVASSDQPMLGRHRIEEGVLIFEPRFPLSPGVTYVAQIREPIGARTQSFTIPKLQMPATELVQIYPSAAELPENQLKFYFYFSRPMSRGEAYRHIRLIKERGEADEAPFLEIAEELWDRTSTRFTLFLDPGRVKRGLKPREEAGPVLEEGHRYSLVVDEAWLDANGNPLKQPTSKSFKVGPPDDTPPDTKNWQIELPTSENEQALRIRFPEPLDRALLERVLWVENAAGERIDGQIQIDRQETRWQFRPAEGWHGGAKYWLAVERILEDRAGNRLGRPFEVDVFDKIDEQVLPEVVRLPLDIRSP